MAWQFHEYLLKARYIMILINSVYIVTGVMTVYVGGQQPEQVTHAPSNVLKGSFVVL